MLYLVGIGLEKKDISQKAIEAVKKSEKVYLESYTSLIAGLTVKELSKEFGKKIIVLNRKEVEETKPFMTKENTALMIYGDPLAATTHQEILIEAREKGIDTEVIHAPSVFNAIAETGLQLYKFGKTASIPFWTTSYKPESFFDILEDNQKIGAHTLFLLDLHPEENKFMTANEAIKMLLEISKNRNSSLFTEKTKVIACARLGTASKVIKTGTAKEVIEQEFGSAPHCLIVPGKLHFVEENALA